MISRPTVSKSYTGLKSFPKHWINGMKRLLLWAIVLLPVLIIFGDRAYAQGKNPVIIIPGLIGSELINGKTGEVVWFKSQRAKDDDLRLPISPSISRNRDGLEPKDVLRTFKIGILPKSDVYEGLAKALETSGYAEGRWSNPPLNGYENTFYCFAYDWRLDNVANARKLIRDIQDLRRKLKKPDLKFDVIAHSMGGSDNAICGHVRRFGYPGWPKACADMGGGRKFPEDIPARHAERRICAIVRFPGKRRFVFRDLDQYPVLSEFDEIRSFHDPGRV